MQLSAEIVFPFERFSLQVSDTRSLWICGIARVLTTWGIIRFYSLFYVPATKYDDNSFRPSREGAILVVIDFDSPRRPLTSYGINLIKKKKKTEITGRLNSLETNGQRVSNAIRVHIAAVVVFVFTYSRISVGNGTQFWLLCYQTFYLSSHLYLIVETVKKNHPFQRDTLFTRDRVTTNAIKYCRTLSIDLSKFT